MGHAVTKTDELFRGFSIIAILCCCFILSGFVCDCTVYHVTTNTYDDLGVQTITEEYITDTKESNVKYMKCQVNPKCDIVIEEMSWFEYRRRIKNKN